MVIIFGASGFIGNYLFTFYQNKNVDVTGTCFKNRRKGLILYDVRNRPEDIVRFIRKDCRFGIIAIDAGSIDYHKAHSDECLRVNQGIKKIVNILYKHGIIPVFLSTDYVFEGDAGNYKEDDPTKPTTRYGKNKLEIENYIKEMGENHIIIRLGKVYGHILGDSTLITDIVEKLLSGEEIKCAGDQIISPTSIYDVINGITKLIDSDERGVFHLSAHNRLSRYEIAKLIKDTMPECKGKVTKCNINDFYFIEKRPLNTTLNSEKITKRFNLAYSSLRGDILRIIKSSAKTCYKMPISKNFSFENA